ncbi:MAG: heme exporter protein CcmD [Lysobacteraceae bacterium]|nr:MAG: heme exporter protein CcmD [Xanthomonadaceae bacterium]
MNYLGYVAAAYAVFAIVLLWDFLAPLLRIRQILRAVRLRARRDAAKTTPFPSSELQR